MGSNKKARYRYNSSTNQDYQPNNEGKIGCPEKLSNDPSEFYGLTLDEDQIKLRDAIWDPNIDAVFVDSPAGTGKSLVSIATAHLMWEYKRYTDMVYVMHPVGDPQGALPGICSIGIETGSLHLDAQNTHLLPFVILFGSGVKSGIEIVGREDIANVDVDAEGFRGVLCGREQGKIGNGSEAVDAEIFNIIGGGAGTLGENHIQKFQIVLQAACRTDTDNIIYIIFFVELPAVDADGRDAHAGGHDGDGDVLPGAGNAHDATDVVDQSAMFQKCFSNKLRTAGIAGHENGFRDAIDRCFIMGSGHKIIPPSYGCKPEFR